MKIRGAGELAGAAVNALTIACEKSSAKNAQDFLSEIWVVARTLLDPTHAFLKVY
jgi:translation initiation factor 2B subunit (eIF-2B alpha/beta/delta family)